MNICTTTDSEMVRAILSKANPLTTISPRCQGGLIINNPFCSDLIFPGSSLTIPLNFNCTSIYIVGHIEFLVVTSPQDYLKLRQNRIKGIQMMQRILEIPTGLQRATLLINLLCRRFGLETASTIPIEFIERLGAVTADQVVTAWQNYGKNLSQLAATRRLSDPAFLSWQQQLYHTNDFAPDSLQPLEPEIISAA